MKRFLPILLLIVFWFIFFWRPIVGGEVWYCCDNLLLNVPSKVFLIEELKDGRFPFWNPYIFSGTAFLADINLAVLHPLNLLYLVLPPFRALSTGILIVFLIGSFGMYFLGRTIRAGRFGSLVGAIVIGFSGSLVVYANNVSILQVAVLVPWVLAWWIRYLDQPTKGRLAVFVVMASFQVFSGHPQLTYYTWLMLGAYSLKRGLVHLVRAGCFVALVSAAQLLPFMELAFSSTRVGRDFAYATIDSVHPLALVRLILPGIVGNLAQGTAWIQAGSVHGYVGFLPLLLMPLAWKNPKGRFFIAMAVVSLLLAMGKYTPLYWFAYHLIPGAAWFRQPGQFLFFWSFGLAASAMVAADHYARTAPMGRRQQVMPMIVLPERLQEKIGALPAGELHAIKESITYNLSLYSVLALVMGLSLGRVRTSALAKLTIIGLLFADLYIYGQTNMTTVSEATVTRWQKSTKERVASWELSGTYRYYTDPAIYPYPDKKPFGQFNDPGESAWQFTILRPNTGMLYGLSAVDGYASLVRASYQQWFGVTVYDPTGVVISSVIDPRLPQAGVRYILTKANNPLLSDASRYRVRTVEGKVALYEDRNAEVAKYGAAGPNVASIGIGLVLTCIGLGWCATTIVRETG